MITYLSMVICIIIFEFFRKKKKFIDFLSIFNLFFLFTYLFPIVVFLRFPERIHEWKFLAAFPNALNSHILLLALFIGYSSVLIGFYIGGKQKKGIRSSLNFKRGENIQFQLLMVFFIITLISFFLYSYGHGGIIELILNGKNIRAKRQSAGLFQYFGYIASGLTFCMLLFYSFLKSSKSTKIRIRAKLFFYLSLSTSLIYALGTAGRGQIGMIFVYLIFLQLCIDRPKFNLSTIILIFSFSIFIYFLVSYGKSAIWTLPTISDGIPAYVEAFNQHKDWYVKKSSNTGLAESLIIFFNQKDHPLVSLHLALNYPEVYQYPRLFYDWVRAFFELIPGINQPEFMVSKTPSALGRDYLGAEGYVPPGWLAMRLINGGIIWLFCGSLLAGFIGGVINRILITNWKMSPIIPGLFIYFAIFWNNYIIGTDPFMFFLPNLEILLFISLFIWIPVIKNENTTPNK